MKITHSIDFVRAESRITETLFAISKQIAFESGVQAHAQGLDAFTPSFSHACYSYERRDYQGWHIAFADLPFIPDTVRFQLSLADEGFPISKTSYRFDALIQCAFPGIEQLSGFYPCESQVADGCHDQSEWVTAGSGGWICLNCKNKLEARRLTVGKYSKFITREPEPEIDPRAIERAKMTPSLRLEILERDGFKCKACGRNPREDDIKLHVDHIHPIAKGGKTEPENLQALCEDCNRAKSDQVIDEMNDWQE